MLKYQRKPPNSYPKNIVKNMNLLRIDKRNPKNMFVIGSSSFRIPIYPSDTDFFEKVSHGDTKKECIQFFKRNIQRVVKEIKNKKNSYLMEVKCGVDKRYDFKIGTCNNNVFTPDKDLLGLVETMFNMKLFSNSEFDTIMDILDNAFKDQLGFETIGQIKRKHYIVRWNSTEILKGYKFLDNNGGKYILEEAIDNVSPINIEMLSIMNNKISDSSNFFYLTYEHNNKDYIINTSSEALLNFEHFFTENLKGAIEQSAYSKFDYNPMKLAKRYFSLGVFIKNSNLLDKVSEIINSRAGLIYQLKSEIATVMKGIEHIKNIPIRILKEQIQNIKYRMANVLEIPQTILIELDNVLDKLDKVAYDPEKIYEMLHKIKELLVEIVDPEVKHMLEDAGLYPVPNYYLPEKRKY